MEGSLRRPSPPLCQHRFVGGWGNRKSWHSSLPEMVYVYDGFTKANSRDLKVIDIFSLDFGCLN